MKYHLATDGEEFRRAYALATELNVPILIHFQEVDHFENEGTWSRDLRRSSRPLLKAFPKTVFIGHADAFWANVSADYHNQAAYPSGPIVPGGVTDRLLGDTRTCTATCRRTPATTCCRATTRSRASSCAATRTSCCSAATAAARMVMAAVSARRTTAAATRLAGKCVARETLTILRRSTTPDVFRKIAWDNAHKMLKIPA